MLTMLLVLRRERFALESSLHFLGHSKVVVVVGAVVAVHGVVWDPSENTHAAVAAVAVARIRGKRVWNTGYLGQKREGCSPGSEGNR